MAVGDPTGADLVSGTTNGDTLPQFGVDPKEDRLISFASPVELTSGVKYAIAIRALDAGGSSDNAFWQTQLIGGYANGSKYSSSNSGSSWSETASQDFWFKTYENANELVDSNTFVQENVVSSLYGVNWQAQTFTAFSTYTIDGVRLRLYREVGATPGTITVSIKATDLGLPSKPINPTPTDAAADVTLDQATITWEDGGNADTYDVYYGDTSGDLTLVSSGQAGLSFTIQDITLGSPFDYLITRYWRVDAINDAGTTTGDEWSFISIAFDQIRVSYRLISGGNGRGPYDSPPGVQGTDWEYTGESNMTTIKRLVAVADSKVWYGSI